jgi:pimeloyl-ACP methyl ester carboxylesterase
VLHGMTRLGPRHPELLRFARSLASTGGRVLVPEIREWVDLDFAPDRTQETLADAVRWLHRDRGTATGGVMLVGFSFGAPQAIQAALARGLEEELRGIIAWGGYSDMKSMFQFSFTGEHTWGGRSYQMDPDPYARWIIGINCLRMLPHDTGGNEVARALRSLATEAGDHQVRADHPKCLALRDELSHSMTSEHAARLFDLFAPPPGAAPDREAALELVETLTPVIRERSPLLDPFESPHVRRESIRIRTPVRILHGGGDRMIPFTESLRLHTRLSECAEDRSVRVLGRFGHSRDRGSAGVVDRTRENLDFIAALRDVFQLG